MLRIRAKIKVRYTVLLCAVLCLGLFVSYRVSVCCDDQLHQSVWKSSDNLPRIDVIRRSFTAKWHDGRELLVDESETVKRARMARKFLGRNKQSPVEELPENDKREEIKMEANEEEIFQNSDVEDPEELQENKIDEDVLEEDYEQDTTEAESITAPKPFEENTGRNNPEDRIPAGNHQTWGENQDQERDIGVKVNLKKDRNLKGTLMDSNRNDKVGKGIQKSRYQIQPNKYAKSTKDAEEIPPKVPPSKEPQNNFSSQNRAGKQSQRHVPDDVKHGDKEVEKYRQERVAEEKADVDDERIDEAEEEEQEENDEGNGVKDGKKISNKTIFDPDDNIITYHILQDRSSFMKSQTNKSRSVGEERASEFPMTPEEAMRRFRDQLPPWEQFEIFHYPKIWYLGLGTNKTYIQSNTTNNFGFDYDAGTEEEGHYKVVIGDHIGYRYEIIKFLGSGTFGSVLLARDWSNPTANNVALKIMHYDENDKYIKREINMMKFIEKNAASRDYFSRMVATFQFRNHKCLVLELLGKSVHRHHIDPVRDMTLFRRFATDILNGMKYLAQMNIVHGDLKPDNIMFINGKNNASEGQLLKVADFGIGCIPGNKEFKCPAYYMQTRYYRAPEVILSLDITPQVDMFSVGVIFAEFYLGVPPFFGETEADQLAAIMEVIGLPPTHMIAKSPRKKIYAKAICYETENGFHRKPYRKPLTKVLRGMDPALFDLIARCLEFDPKERITPEAALRHPFITGVFPAVGLVPSLTIKRLLGDV